MTGDQEIKALAATYTPQERDSLLGLTREYRTRWEREVLEIAALAADVSLNSVTTFGLEPDVNPQFEEAFRLHYPNVPLESLRGREEYAEKLINGAKGKYFEVLVRDRLNGGERVGEIHLGPGEVARLAESPTQPGWDLRIENADGSIVEDIQLKATESMSYIKQALDKYPDIRVAAPSDIDGSTDEILSTDISNEQLARVTQTQVDELAEGPVEDFLHKGGELAVDSIPLASVLVTGVIEGRNLLAGRSTLRESLRRGAGRVGKSVAYDALAAVPAVGQVAVVLRIVEGRVTARVASRIALSDRLESRTGELRQLTG